MQPPTKIEEISKLAQDATAAYGRALLADQMKAVTNAKLDSGSKEHQNIKDLFLVGAMWKFCEQFDLPSSPEDRAFDGLKKMLIESGASTDVSERYVSELKRAAHRTGLNGQSALAFGRECADVECALAALLAASASQTIHVSAIRFLLGALALSLVVLAMIVMLAQFAQVGAPEAWALGYAIAWCVLCIGVALYVAKLTGKRA